MTSCHQEHDLGCGGWPTTSSSPSLRASQTRGFRLSSPSANTGWRAGSATVALAVMQRAEDMDLE